ncbi:ATP synthase F1 subunit gamma [Candidatus Falkowbacteria bacterium]|nr:ATP synthase F1 subunit gamma [Candidatus Falkowbacteria bacterium]
MTSAKEIKKRIKSISNTKKITKAMEMVAAAKMRRSVEAVLRTRTYANLGWATILNISESKDADKISHPLLEKRKEVKKALIVLIASNRGLCGGFNSAIINKALASVKKHKIPTDFIIIGKRGISIASRFGQNIISEFEKNDSSLIMTDVVAPAKMIINDFLEKKYDKVLMAYTDFISPAKQVPRMRQILPVDIANEDEYLGVVGKSEILKTSKDYIKEKEEKYLSGGFSFMYEPDADEVLDKILPRMIEVQLFQALLESNASEHSARMAAMNKATSAASDLVDELTLYYNKARQAAITAEIAEISAGVAGMKA